MRRRKYCPVVSSSILPVNCWFTVDCDFEIVVGCGNFWLVTTRDQRLTSDHFARRHFLIVNVLLSDWFMDKPLLGYVDTYRIGHSFYHVFEDDWDAYYPTRTLPDHQQGTGER